VKLKTFREDLYYRLNVVRIRMPALRERGDDVPQIVDFCLQNLFKQRKARASKVSPEAMAVLVRYRWPGNVRELENVIYRSAVIAQGEAILVKNLPREVLEAAGEGSAAPFEPMAAATNPPAPVRADSSAVKEPILTLQHALDFVYVQMVRSGTGGLPAIKAAMRARALAESGGDAVKAAELLGTGVPAAPQAAGKRPATKKAKP